MSYDENRISDLIDGGLNEKKELELTIQQLQEENKRLKEDLFETQHYLDTKEIVNEHLKKDKQELLYILKESLGLYGKTELEDFQEKAEEQIKKHSNEA